MAVYKIFPKKDASLYTISSSMNTGLDEILDFSTKVMEGRGQTNRALIQFSSTEVVNTIDNLVGSGTSFINGTVLPAFGAATPGAALGGTPGTYNNIPINGVASSASNALATVVVDGAGEISNATITSTGSFYRRGEKLSINAGVLGSNLKAETVGSLVYSDLDYGASLRAYVAVVTGLSQDATVEVYPVSGTWNMGTGKFSDSPPVENGCSWVWTLSSGSDVGGTEDKWQLTGFAAGAPYATASYSSSMEGGGNWYYADSSGTDYEFKQVLSYGNSLDLDIDIKRSIDQQYKYEQNPATGQKNDGFIIKQTGSQEFLNDLNTQVTARYFSIDTNTIYPPMLEIKWDDFNFNTGSSDNDIINTPEAFMSVYNNNGTYYSGSVTRFRVAAIPKYPDIVFQTASRYTTNFYLPPQVSYYGIKDTDTNEMVIDFDNKYTKVSADQVSSYFDLHMSGLEPERYYTIMFKTTIDGTTKIFDEDIMFKVVNGG